MTRCLRAVISNTALTVTRLGECRLQWFLAVDHGFGKFGRVIQHRSGVVNTTKRYPCKIGIYAAFISPASFFWFGPQHRL